MTRRLLRPCQAGGGEDVRNMYDCPSTITSRSVSAAGAGSGAACGTAVAPTVVDAVGIADSEFSSRGAHPDSQNAATVVAALRTAGVRSCM